MGERGKEEARGGGRREGSEGERREERRGQSLTGNTHGQFHSAL